MVWQEVCPGERPIHMQLVECFTDTFEVKLAYGVAESFHIFADILLVVLTIIESGILKSPALIFLIVFQFITLILPVFVSCIMGLCC